MPFKLADLDQTKLVTTLPLGTLRDEGERFSSEDMQNAVDTLKPLAVGYAGVITGYDARYLAELLYVDSIMRPAVAERVEQRKGQKVGGRQAEAETVRAGKGLLREVTAVIDNAILTRPRVAAETEEARAEGTARLVSEAKAIRGKVGTNPVDLGLRLRNASTLLANPALGARITELQGTRGLAAEVEAMVGRLQDVAQIKGAQKTAQTNTSDLDVLDGLIYENLKALTRAGRAYFGARGDAARAATFTLDILRPGRGKATATPTDAPATAATEPVTP